MTQKLVKDSFGLRLITTRLVSGRYVDTARRITQAQAARWALRRLMSRKMAGIVKAACPA